MGTASPEIKVESHFKERYIRAMVDVALTGGPRGEFLSSTVAGRIHAASSGEYFPMPTAPVPTLAGETIFQQPMAVEKSLRSVLAAEYIVNHINPEDGAALRPQGILKVDNDQASVLFSIEQPLCRLSSTIWVEYEPSALRVRKSLAVAARYLATLHRMHITHGNPTPSILATHQGSSVPVYFGLERARLHEGDTELFCMQRDDDIADFLLTQRRPFDAAAIDYFVTLYNGQFEDYEGCPRISAQRIEDISSRPVRLVS